MNKHTILTGKASISKRDKAREIASVIGSWIELDAYKFDKPLEIAKLLAEQKPRAIIVYGDITPVMAKRLGEWLTRKEIVVLNGEGNYVIIKAPTIIFCIDTLVVPTPDRKRFTVINYTGDQDDK
jgi:hypothetical protein